MKDEKGLFGPTRLAWVVYLSGTTVALYLADSWDPGPKSGEGEWERWLRAKDLLIYAWSVVVLVATILAFRGTRAVSSLWKRVILVSIQGFVGWIAAIVLMVLLAVMGHGSSFFR